MHPSRRRQSLPQLIQAFAWSLRLGLARVRHPSPQQVGEVRDDRKIHDDSSGLPGTRAVHELVELEREQERGRDHRQVLGPQLVEPQAGALDQLEHPVADRDNRGDAQLGGVEVMKIGDDAVEKGPPRIELDRAHHALSEAAEVGVQVEEQVDAGAEEQQATCSALDGDQAENASAAGRVCGSGHRATNYRRYVPNSLAAALKRATVSAKLPVDASKLLASS